MNNFLAFQMVLHFLNKSGWHEKEKKIKGKYKVLGNSYFQKQK